MRVLSIKPPYDVGDLKRNPNLENYPKVDESMLLWLRLPGWMCTHAQGGLGFRV